MTEETAAAAEAPAPDEDAKMAEIYQKMTAEEPVETQEEPQEQVETAEEAAEPEKPVVEAPSDLPAGIKAHWSDIPEAAREAFLSSQRDMSRKLTEQGRVVQAAKPVYDVLVQAANDIPTMRNMTPQQIANDVFQMARIQAELATNPTKVLLEVAKDYGAIEQLRQALSGVEPTSQIEGELRELKAQLKQFATPEVIDQRVARTIAERDAGQVVSDFARGQEYWSEVEDVLPTFIPLVNLGDGASAQDILAAAYDMAIHANPVLRAKVAAAAQAPVEPDPKRTEAQLKAKSVNVVSRPTGTPRQLSEEEQMRATYRKLTAS